MTGSGSCCSLQPTTVMSEVMPRQSVTGSEALLQSVSGLRISQETERSLDWIALLVVFLVLLIVYRRED